MPGDFVAHGYAFNPLEAGTGDIPTLKKVIENVAQEVANRFPNAVVIPSVGNNDPEVYF